MSSVTENKQLDLINAVRNNDVELIKSLLDSNEMYTITSDEESGDNLLQIAMHAKRYKAFNYLVSIENFPLDLENSEGETALETALDKSNYYCLSRSDIPQYFATTLIKKGADITRPMLLHYSVKRAFGAAARELLKKGVDLNEQDSDGVTPLNACFIHQSQETKEIPSMLLCHGADPVIANDEGNMPFFSAIEKYLVIRNRCRRREAFLPVLENLFLYTFDGLGRYEIPVDLYIVARGLKIPVPFIDQIFGPQYINQVNLYCSESSESSLIYLFQDGRDILAKFIEQYPNLLREMLLNFSNAGFFHCLNDSDSEDDVNSEGDENSGCYRNFWWNGINCEIFDTVINSELRSEMINMIASIDSFSLIFNLIFRDGLEEKPMTNLICYLLSYGLSMNDVNLRSIYDQYGFGELLNICLHMDLIPHDYFKIDYAMHGIPRLLVDVNVDIQDYIDNPSKCCPKDLIFLLDHCAHPKLQDYCRNMEHDEIANKLNGLPKVPCLTELARNAFRKHFIKKYNITSYKQFYSLLQSLPISVTHEKIITFETKLYNK